MWAQPECNHLVSSEVSPQSFFPISHQTWWFWDHSLGLPTSPHNHRMCWAWIARLPFWNAHHKGIYPSCDKPTTMLLMRIVLCFDEGITILQSQFHWAALSTLPVPYMSYSSPFKFIFYALHAFHAVIILCFCVFFCSTWLPLACRPGSLLLTPTAVCAFHPQLPANILFYSTPTSVPWHLFHQLLQPNSLIYTFTTFTTQYSPFLFTSIQKIMNEYL